MRKQLRFCIVNIYYLRLLENILSRRQLPVDADSPEANFQHLVHFHRDLSAVLNLVIENNPDRKLIDSFGFWNVRTIEHDLLDSFHLGWNIWVDSFYLL